VGTVLGAFSGVQDTLLGLEVRHNAQDSPAQAVDAYAGTDIANLRSVGGLVITWTWVNAQQKLEQTNRKAALSMASGSSPPLLLVKRWESVWDPQASPRAGKTPPKTSSPP